MQLQMRKLNEKTLLNIGFGWPGKKKNGHGHFNEKNQFSHNLLYVKHVLLGTLYLLLLTF